MEYFKILVYSIAIIIGVYQLITNKFIEEEEEEEEEEEKRKIILNKFLLAFFILFLVFQLIDIFKSI
jgi:uncharacterized membrane protein